MKGARTLARLTPIERAVLVQVCGNVIKSCKKEEKDKKTKKNTYITDSDFQLSFDSRTFEILQAAFDKLH